MSKKLFKFSIVAMIVVMALALVPVSTVDAGTTAYSGDNTGGPTYNRQFGDCSGTSGVGTAVNYHEQLFYVDTAGSYDFYSLQTYDGFLTLYLDPFDPADSTINCLASNDDFNFVGDSGFTFALTANTTYSLVTSAFSNGQVGTFTNTITGPGNIVLGPYAPAPAAMNIPNNGLVLINAWEATVAYDGPAGNPVTLSGGGILVLPNDADRNGYDTYTVTDTATVDGATWVSIFIGNENFVWVPWSAVHPASYFAE